MTPLILYIPGLLPKPAADVHKAELRRCLLSAVAKVDGNLATEIDEAEYSFDIVSWTYDFYLEHRDIQLDRASIDAVIAQQAPRADDIREAAGWKRRLTVWLYRLGDLLPFLIPHLATERMAVHIRDLRRYLSNDNGIADHTREMLKIALRAGGEAARPILLIAHSMGSIIAYDALWEMSRNEKDHARIDRLLTMGSPLGQNYVQRRILGHDRERVERYPNNIRRWTNLAAVGDLTAIDRVLANDFGEMLDLDLLESLEDIDLYTWFRLDGQLNVHAEYGYLVSEACGRVIADWWREVSSSQDLA